jgi:hypothetical protein
VKTNTVVILIMHNVGSHPLLDCMQE